MAKAVAHNGLSDDPVVVEGLAADGGAITGPAHPGLPGTQVAVVVATGVPHLQVPLLQVPPLALQKYEVPGPVFVRPLASIKVAGLFAA